MHKCFSHIGTHQGSCIATAGAILPYHNKLRQLCREFRDATVLCDADYTVADVPKLELDRFLERKASLQGQCVLTSNRSKNAAHAPDGDYTGLPDDIPISPHGLGDARGFPRGGRLVLPHAKRQAFREACSSRQH